MYRNRWFSLSFLVNDGNRYANRLILILNICTKENSTEERKHGRQSTVRVIKKALAKRQCLTPESVEAVWHVRDEGEICRAFQVGWALVPRPGSMSGTSSWDYQLGMLKTQKRSVSGKWGEM